MHKLETLPHTRPRWRGLSIAPAGCTHLLKVTSKPCIQGAFTSHPNPHIVALRGEGGMQLSLSEFSLLLSVACSVSLEDSVSYLDNDHPYYYYYPPCSGLTSSWKWTDCLETSCTVQSLYPKTIHVLLRGWPHPLPSSLLFDCLASKYICKHTGGSCLQVIVLAWRAVCPEGLLQLALSVNLHSRLPAQITFSFLLFVL